MLKDIDMKRLPFFFFFADVGFIFFAFIQSEARFAELGDVPRACRVKCFGHSGTSLRYISSKQVREVNVEPIKNELSSPNFFGFDEH